jgi:hypothetical protein
MVVYTIYSSISQIDLELFCDAKTPMLFVPCHVHKQKLNEKKNILAPSYMYYSFISRCIFFKKNTIIILLSLQKKKTTHLMNDISYVNSKNLSMSMEFDSFYQHHS